MILVQIVVSGLAGWRAASLLSKEDGPWNVFGIIRECVGIRPRTELSMLAKLWACPWCLSIWTTGIFWGLWYVHPAIPGVAAAMTIAILAEQWVRPVR